MFVDDVAAMLRAEKNVSGSCYCPKPCEQIVYEPSLSYALLSTMSVEQILNREDFDLKGRYMVALETGQRVDAEVFTNDINMLSNLYRYYQDMKRLIRDFLNSNVTEATAIKVLDTVTEIKEIAINDSRVLLEDLLGYRQTYNALFEDSINLTLYYDGRMEETYKEVMQLMKISIENKRKQEYLNAKADKGKELATLIYESVDWIENDLVSKEILERELRSRSRYRFRSDSDYRLIKSGEYEKYESTYPESFYQTDQNCELKFSSLKNSLSSLKNTYSTIRSVSSLHNNPTRYTNLLKDDTTKYDTAFEEAEECFNRYPRILQRIDDWLNGHTLHSVEKTMGKEKKTRELSIEEFASQKKNLEADEEIVKDVLDKYSLNKEDMSKMDYLRTITGELESNQGETLRARINTFVSQVIRQTTDPLKDQISTAKQELESWYKEVLNLAVDVDPYLRSGYFHDKASYMKIWKEPGPNLEDPKNPIYNQQTLEMWRIWDNNMDTKTFVQVKSQRFKCHYFLNVYLLSCFL